MSGASILIDPSSIERIEVIKGPASVLYGSDALGGVVNIITKKGSKKPFEAEGSVAWNGAGHGWAETISLGGTYKGLNYHWMLVIRATETSRLRSDTRKVQTSVRRMLLLS